MKRGIVAAVERATNDDGQQIIELQVDPEGSATVTAEYFDATGEDSPPLVGDSVALIEGPAEGTMQAVAWQDPKNPTKSADGEKRLYARDAHGVPTVEIWLKSDSEAQITVFKDGMALRLKNANGPIILDSNDVRAGAGAGRAIACVGDLISGAIRFLCGAPGSPALPLGGAPTPTGGIPFVARVLSGSPKAKAT